MGAHPPVLLVKIEICPYLIQHCSLHLKQSSTSGFGIRAHNVDNEPFLILALRRGGVPVLDLFLDGVLVRLCILREWLNKHIRKERAYHKPRTRQYTRSAAAVPVLSGESGMYAHLVLRQQRPASRLVLV